MYGEELEGEWAPPPEGGALPISDDVFFNQIRMNCKRDLPMLNREAKNDKIMVMVCGGPSAKLHLEDIRKKAKDDKYIVFCSNNTHDWLIENDIIPQYQFMIDPKEHKWKDVQNPRKDIKYLIGLCSHPKVFEMLEGHDVTMVASLGGTIVDGISDVQMLKAFFKKDEYIVLEGGTMAGLRAMTLGNVLGYQTVEFYGFDSCFFDKDKDGRPVYYSYDKSRGENIMECKCDDGKIYQSTPVFASQARQFIKWKHKLGWMKFIIHGDSLTHHIDMLDTERHRPKHDLLITDYMKKMNEKMFSKEKALGGEKELEFGVSGHEYAGPVAVLAGQLAKKYKKITLLDYGCGQGTFKKVFPELKGVTVREYDPCVSKKTRKPRPADVVVCTDVLEHVEGECLENVLNHLQALIKKVGFISICLTPAAKNYSDGRNCHLSILPFDIWFAKLQKRFNIVEVKAQKSPGGHDLLIAIVQSKELDVKIKSGSGETK